MGDFSLSIAVIADETSHDVHGDELQDSESPWRYSEIQLKMHDVLRQFLEDEDWREQAALLGGIESGASLEDNHFEIRVAAALDALKVKRPKLVRITWNP